MKKILALMSLMIVQTAVADTEVDRYGVLPQIQQMSVSPNGEQVAFRSVSLESDTVSVVNLKSGKTVAAIGVASVKPRDVRLIQDNRLIMTVSDRKKIPGFVGSVEISTAITYDIKKNKYQQLLVPGEDDVYVGQSDLHRVLGISPDGKSVYMPAYSGVPSFVNGSQVMPPLSLFLKNINGSGTARIHKRGRGGANDFFLADNGKVLAVEAFEDDKDIHRISAYHGKKLVEIFSEETPYEVKDFIGVSLDEKKLLMIDNNEKNRTVVYTLALKDGTLEGPLYGKANADIVGYIIDPQRKVIGVRYSGFKPSYTFFDADLNQRVAAITAGFPQDSVWVEEVSPDRKHVLVRVEGSQSSGEYYLYSKGKKTVFIASRRPQILKEHVHPIVPVTFAARDGLKIPTLITAPRDKLENLQNLPAIMMPHGGPEHYDSIGFDYLAQAFAQQGYVVIQPQFRGSVGFGEEHQAAGYGEWGRKALNDLTDAADFFVKQGIVDKQRMCIVGASYGGYSALAGGAFTPDLYKCVVSINGIGNLEDMLDRTRRERGRSSSSLEYWEAQILGFGKKDKDVAKQRSPELYASAFTAPVLLIHSEKDEVVHPRQSVSMYKALKKVNKAAEKIELKGEDHYLSDGETRLQALKSIIGFVNKNI